MENRLITSYLRVSFPWKFRQLVFTAFLASFLFISKLEGRVIKLNLNFDSDQDYQEDEGVWRAIILSPCGQERKCHLCHIIYYSGSFPRPKSIRATGMAGTDGGGKIRVQGRRNATGQEYDYHAMEFSSEESDVNPEFGGVFKAAIDFQETYAFRFDLTVQTAGSTAILDSIQIKIDLSDEIPEPRKSSRPTPPKTEFSLDDRSDHYNITISNVNGSTVLVDSLLVTFARKDEPKPTSDGASSALPSHIALYTRGVSTLALCFLAATLLQIN